MIKYSIIVPCYNSERFIKVCMDGLLRLSFDNNRFEVIFIDDCSTDNSRQLITDYIANTNFTIKLIENKKNTGPGVARRYAAEAADGDYLCFCDSDDWYDSDLLFDIDKEIRDKGSDLVFFDMSYLIGNKKIKKNYTEHFLQGDKLSYLSNCTESLCNMTVKRSIYLSVPPIDIRNGEDLALVPLIIAKASKISHIDKSYYNYVMRGNSASLRHPHRMAFYNMILAFEHIQKHLNVGNHDLEKITEFLGIKTVLYNATLMAIKGGNKNNLLSKIVTDFSISYPLWNSNVNNKKLSRLKLMYLWLLKHKIWSLCRLYALLHSLILSRHV